MEQFLACDYPADQQKPLSYFKSARGFKSESQVLDLKQKYGKNTFDIPVPTFQELFQEHMVAPFFVFQLFCVALWFLDEMWYYSLFTLVMLFVFESTVVMQRLKTLQEFRTMSTKPYPIYVFRENQWKQIQTDDLIPGDICSIVRSEEESPVSCDILLLEGTCIANEAMLSGESTPQLKEPIADLEDTDNFVEDNLKLSILYGGTKIIQTHASPDNETGLKAPDGGCIGYVLRTGFSTQQGELVRVILYSTERVTANNLESLFFILFLLVFAVIASHYVWTEGTKNEERKKSKVLLDCILILTSVVPPELPMELSLAVNNSLIALARKYIFCTEPFRIPYAGKIDVACFDKTGTLTAEDLLLEGVFGFGNEKTVIQKPSAFPKETTLVLAASHSLIDLEGTILGDPMEKHTLEAIQWKLKDNDMVAPAKGSSLHARIKRRFAFSSSLKRMSTISVLNDGKMFVATKGAPEVLKSMFKDAGKDYDEVYKYWARQGSRVLALGYKYLDSNKTDIHSIHRQDVEHDLVFAGFISFHCPLKSDSAEAVKMLNKSSHRVVMITGDNALTACHVARQVKIVKKSVLIGDLWDGKNLTWRSVDEKDDVKYDTQSKTLGPLAKYDLCITGSALSIIYGTPCFSALLPRLWVYARVSPSQKEMILTSLKSAGYTTLMCGDGTNDVGALKQAHVGIALLDGTEEGMQKINERMRLLRQKQMYDQQNAMRAKWNMPPLPPPPELQKAFGLKPAAPQEETLDERQKKMNKNLEAQQKLQEKLQEMMGDMDDVPQIKFGDASVAAPFTSKISSVMSVCNIIRQGRSTLVAMTQMYKILALNSIVSAYCLSVQYLAGIKQGDW